jgi:hypothetical protein
MKTTVEMAKEAGFTWEPINNIIGPLERFKALVAAAERERIIAANAREIERVNAHIKALEAAVLAERERFASECINLVAMYGGPVDLEAAIRARSKS